MLILTAIGSNSVNGYQPKGRATSFLIYKTTLMYNLHKYCLMKAPVIDPVFRAIADPTRRKIIDLLAGSRQSVKQLTAHFDISQPAVSQHLRELRASKLVRSERLGVEQIYSLTADPLAEVYGWVSRYRRFFDPSGHAWAFAPSQAVVSGQKSRKGTKKHGD